MDNPLTPDNAVLMFVDHQTGLLLAVDSLHAALLKNNIGALARVATIYGLPVILTVSAATNPQGPGPLVPELRDAFPGQPVIDRTTVDAWDDPRVVAAIAQTGRRKVVVAGIATDAGVAFTALSAARAGYEAYVVTDASATWSAQAETAALLRLSQAGVVPMSWVAVAAELQADWSRPTAGALADLLQTHIARWGYVAAHGGA